LPGPIDTNNKELQAALGMNASDLQELVKGQSSSNIFKDAEEVQFHVVIVCVCLYVLCLYFN